LADDAPVGNKKLEVSEEMGIDNTLDVPKEVALDDGIPNVEKLKISEEVALDNGAPDIEELRCSKNVSSGMEKLKPSNGTGFDDGTPDIGIPFHAGRPSLSGSKFTGWRRSSEAVPSDSSGLVVSPFQDAVSGLLNGSRFMGWFMGWGRSSDVVPLVAVPRCSIRVAKHCVIDGRMDWHSTG
jgi:hypothetical protein